MTDTQIAAHRRRPMTLRDDVVARLKKLMAVTDDLVVVAEATIPLVRDAERERCAAWHDEQAAWHEERADHPVTKIDGSSSKIGHDLAAHRRRQAAWHREAAAAIRNLKEQAND